MDKEHVFNLIHKVEETMIQTRRYLHENPEVSSKEYQTSQFLKDAVTKLGLPVVSVANSTGFFAILDTGKPGKTLGIRTDIDALPVQENPHNLKGARTCVSKNDGFMHACGHDGHMATVLGSIQVLLELRERLSGKILFIFEEGEEIGSGIHQMINALRPYNLNAVYGTHLTSFMDTGTVCIDGGPRMAGSITIDFEVVGRGGHGSRPDLSINPVFAMANVLTGIASAWANQIDVSKTVTLGITQFNAGTTYNVFPDTASVGGSLRYFDYSEGVHALEVFKHVASKTAEAHLCEAVFKKSTEVTTIPLINDDGLARLAREACRELYGDNVVEDIIWYASESFAHYSVLAPIVFAFVGTRNETVGSGAEHHNTYFDIDEASLSVSLGATVMFALSFLKQY